MYCLPLRESKRERHRGRDSKGTFVWCSLALLQKPLPHCSGVAQSICLHQSVTMKSQIWILCNHQWRFVVFFLLCFLNFVSSSRNSTITMGFFFLFISSSTENLKNYKQSLQVNDLTANVLFIRGNKGLHLKKMDHLCGPCKVFLFRLSGPTTERGRIKGKQQVVWAGAQRQNIHAYTQKIARTLLHFNTYTHCRSRCAD